MQTKICDCRKEGSSWRLPIYLEMIVNHYGIVNCPQLYSKQSVYKNSGNLVKSRLAAVFCHILFLKNNVKKLSILAIVFPHLYNKNYISMKGLFRIKG